MINPKIKQQLHMLKIADIPDIQENKYVYFFDKRTPTQFLIQEGHYYLLELESYLLKPSNDFTLHANWNNNIIPKNKYLKCRVVKVMGKMVKIEGVGFDYENKTDLDKYWDGWLPIKSVKILREI